MKRARKIGLITAVTAVMMVTLIGAASRPDIYFLIKKNFTIFSEVYREVSLNYVDKVDPEKLMRKGINAMLESLDPYTVFIDEADNQDMEIITRGSYGGVGLDVGIRGHNIVVIAPMEGYAAFRKGIRSGDVIKSVNGVAVSDLSPDEVRNLTVGEPGTTVTLTIRRYGIDHDMSFKLKRERIEVKNVAYQGRIGPDKEIGYILLSRFSPNAAAEIRDAITGMQSKGKLRGLILDLRNNPGGLLEEAVKTVDKFTQPGVKVVETKGRLSEHNNVFRTEEPALVGDLPLVVLQNGGSASASEIVAGALQDLDRAVIIGQRSFGKGLVQIVRPLPYNTALKITTSRYYIPSGRSIQAVTYTHDAHNSVVQKPDSMHKAYKTRNGRTVYAGEGIAPDIPVDSVRPTLLETSLRKQSRFFFFANHYTASHDTFNADGVSDKLFTAFKNYLKDEHFNYKTQSERFLDKVKDHFQSSGAQQLVDSHIQAIEKTIERQKQEDFDRQSEELKRMLYLELVARYRGTTGQTEASLKFDPAVARALQVLNDPGRYSSILSH